MTADVPPTDQHHAAEQAQPHAVSYLAAPVGEVRATEAAVAALGRTRPWAMMAMIVFFVAGAIGAGGGTALIVIYFLFHGRPNWNDVTPVNLVLGGAGLIYGLPLLVAGVLLASFIRAVGRTVSLRRPEDLERALIAQQRFWRVAALILLGVLISPFVVMGLAVWTGAWD